MLVDILKKVKLVRKLFYAVVGIVTYPGLAMVNKIKISGTEYLKQLPKQNVLFVSNHQTYFADVMAFLHIFCAAEETMKDNLLTKFFTLAGAITIKRTWRAGGKDIKREVDSNDYTKIYGALKKRWVITFPQGTTKPFAPGRKGTAHIIKEMNPVVVPVVINGFWRAFNRKGLKFKKKGTVLSVQFKEPIHFDASLTIDEILDQVMDAIEQSTQFMLQGKHHQQISPA